MPGGTKINGCFTLGMPWRKVSVPQLQCAGLGIDMAIFDEHGSAIGSKTTESIYRISCPSMPLHFTHDPFHSKYHKAFFGTFGENIWSHEDFSLHTEFGMFVISGRLDSPLSPGGIRIGTVGSRGIRFNGFHPSCPCNR